MERGPLVADLVKEHKTEIDRILAKYKDKKESAGALIDELFVLRFILSDKKNAEKKLQEALEWREKNKESLLEAVANDGGKDLHKLLKYTKRGVCGWIMNQFLVNVVRAGLGDAVGLMKELKPEEITHDILMEDEVIFRMIDAKTRETGYLCKVINIMDFHGFSFSRIDRRFFASLGAASHTASIVYPQFLAKVVTVN